MDMHKPKESYTSVLKFHSLHITKDYYDEKISLESYECAKSIDETCILYHDDEMEEPIEKKWKLKTMKKKMRKAFIADRPRKNSLSSSRSINSLR